MKLIILCVAGIFIDFFHFSGKGMYCILLYASCSMNHGSENKDRGG